MTEDLREASKRWSMHMGGNAKSRMFTSSFFLVQCFFSLDSFVLFCLVQASQRIGRKLAEDGVYRKWDLDTKQLDWIAAA